MPDQRMTGLFGLSPSTADVRDILSTIPVRKGGVLPLTEYGDGTSRLDWTAGIPGSLWDAFTAPARAYRGEIPEDQMIPEGLNFAGSVALGSAAVPRPTNAAGMFAGEVEARTVQKRMDLTPEERRARPPWLDYDVPEADQIVRFGGSGPQMSVPEVPGTVLSSASHLDMSPEARMARAREMGFNTSDTYYHGTHSDFDQFDTSGIGVLGRGTYFTRNAPGTASVWARGEDGSVIPAYIRGNYPDISEAGALYRYMPGFIQKRMAESRGHDGYTTGGGAIVAVHDPSNIRSVNAAFDPAKSSSANLLAANPETGAAPGLGLMAAAKQEPKGFIAYHGSPHDFDRFDISRIGTGEGVQAYGHGLYAADSPAVADSYRGAGNRGEWNYDPSIKRTLAEQEALSWLGSPAAQGTTNIRDLPQLARFGREPDLPWIKALDDLIARGEISRPGRLYQVRINADPDHFLDWDKPLSQQSEAVRKVDDAYWAKHPNGIPDASYFLKSQEGAQAMRDAGIPGIKYLDQGSRAAGNGSRNYVVFDDKLIDILKKYGLFGSLGMGAASMMSGGEANAAPAPKASPLWALQPGVF